MGKTFGLSTAEVFGLSAALKDMGLSNEVSGSAMSRTLGIMLKNVDKFAKFSNISFDEFSKLIKDKPIEALNLFLKQLGTLDKVSQVKALKELGLDSVETSGALLKMSTNFQIVKKDIATANQEWARNTSLQNEYNTAAQGLNAQIQQTKNTMIELGVKIGDALLPVIKDLNQDFQEWVKSLDPATLQNFGQIIGGLVTTLAELASGAGDVITDIGSLVGAFPSLTSTVTIAAGTVAALIKTFKMIEGAAALFGVAIESGSTKISSFKNAITLVSDAVGKMGSIFGVAGGAMGALGLVAAGLYAEYDHLATSIAAANNAAANEGAAHTQTLQQIGQMLGELNAQYQQAGAVQAQLRQETETALQNEIASLSQYIELQKQKSSLTDSEKLQLESMQKTLDMYKQKLVQVSNMKVQIDTTSAQTNVSQLQDSVAKVVAVAKEPAKMQLDADTAKAEDKLKQTKEQTQKLNAKMSVDAETAKALNEIKDLTIQVKSLKTFIIVDAATEPAMGTVRQLEQTVMNVEAVMKIKIDASQALAAIRALERPTSSVHTVYVKEVNSRAGGGYIQKLAVGGVFTGHGRVPGYDPLDRDLVNAKLTGGEYVIRRSAVDAIGRATLDYMNQNKRVPKFASGTPSTTTPVVLNIGTQSFEMSSDAEVAAALQRYIEKEGGL
jgi:hypothetical protein